MPALFIETIRLERGIAQNIELHYKRMEQTARELNFIPAHLPPIEQLCPPNLTIGTTKCRIVYRETIESITFEEYSPRTINTLALVSIPEGYSYKYKFLRRHILDELRLSSGADEVILVDKEGHVTDSSYSNLLFKTEKGDWVTPSTPLLAGTMRRLLLNEGISSEGTRITEAKITVNDLPKYTHVALINAMMPLNKAITCPITTTSIINLPCL